MESDQHSWNSVAKQYENKFNGLDLYVGSYEAFSKWIDNPDAFILELGCGPATATVHLHKNNPNWRILATDYAPEMLDAARRLIPDIQFQLLDCRKVDSLSGTFDGIFAGFCLPYIRENEIAEFLSACSRKLKENGILYLSFVNGDSAKSGLRKSTDGKIELHFSYHSEENLRNILAQGEMTCVDTFVFEYPVSISESEKHQVLIFRKKTAKKYH